MRSLGVAMDDDAIQEMMIEADESADGVVDYSEFLAACCGPAGLKAALEAAGRGLRVALVEPKEHLTAAPTGAHSKCMREAVMENKASDLARDSQPDRAGGAGCRGQCCTAAADLPRDHLARLGDLRGGSAALDVILGVVGRDPSTIRFTDDNGGTQALKTTGTVIATGSRANRLPMVPFDLPGVYDSDTLAEIDYIPKHMVVQGGGIIGAAEWDPLMGRLLGEFAS
eukprot:Skav207560  [mRNA]  locus=scaffold3235:167164:172415:- [translate_table: standard]